MVAKTVKQLCRLGYLEQVDGAGKQKEIHFTKTGEYLMSDARRLLAELDEVLSSKTGGRSPQAIIEELNTVSSAVSNRQDS